MSDQSNPCWGSTLEDFLKEEGIYEAARTTALLRVVAWQLAQEMEQQGLSKTELAARMHTSRAQLDRVLKAEGNVTLQTLQRAAALVGRELHVELQEPIDWTRFDAMSADARHRAALDDPDAQPLTEADFTRMKRTPQAKLIRRALDFTQEEFAARYHIPLGTLRDWEQGRAEPDQATRAYLTVIARDPEGVQRALQPPSDRAIAALPAG